MKWYWALLVTAVLLSLVGNLSTLAITADGAGGSRLAVFAVGIAAVWVAADSASFRWGLAALLLFPICLPWYLIKRGIEKGEAERRAESEEPH